MRAIVITQPGGPDVLQLQERPLPQPGGEQVRVRVLIAGLNRADLLQRAGHYPAPAGSPPDIPGLEIMGIVDAVGPDATFWQVGQRVFGIVGGGGYSEFVLTHERLLAPVPDNLSDEEAGAVPEVFMTAHDALFTQGAMKLGERVLIHTVGGGVGTAAVQLVCAAGGTSYGSSRSPEKAERAKEYGLDVALPAPDFLPALKAATGDTGVQLILDFVGGPYTAANLEALALKGRLVQIGTLEHAKVELDLGVIMRKRLRLTGTVLRSRPLEEKASVTRRFTEEVVPLLKRGAVRPIIDRVFPFEQAAQAHTYLESNASFGKVLLKLG
jgi:NADPH:quinone reductase